MQVVAALKWISRGRGAPKRIFCGTGSEFVGRALDLRVYVDKVSIGSLRPSKSLQRASSHSTDDCARRAWNRHWFVSMRNAKRVIEAWHTDSNEAGLTRLQEPTPTEFALAAGTCAGPPERWDAENSQLTQYECEVTLRTPLRTKSATLRPWHARSRHSYWLCPRYGVIQ